MTLRVLEPETAALEGGDLVGRRLRQEVARAPEAGLGRQRAPEVRVVDVAVLAVQHAHRRQPAPRCCHVPERRPARSEADFNMSPFSLDGLAR